MTFGTGEYQYALAEAWGGFPDWSWGMIAGLACDSRGQVYVYSRGETPLAVYDQDGILLHSRGKGVLGHGAHGIHIDADDSVYCVDAAEHCLYKLGPDGELLLQIGTPGQPAARDSGEPFNGPTDVAVSEAGEIYVSDGYGNARVHKFSANGEWLMSWGDRGEGPGRFALPHGIGLDRHGRVWVCDREGGCVQVFDADGKCLTHLSNLRRPSAIAFDRVEDIVYIAQLERRVGVYSFEGQLLSEWGGSKPIDAPGEFLGGPHGLCVNSRGDIFVSEALVSGRLHKFVRLR